MMTLYGSYEQSIDEKGRFLMPVGIRQQLADGCSAFCVTLCPFKSESSIWIYSRTEWVKLCTELQTLDSPPDSVAFRMRRILMSFAQDVNLDNAGRILLPRKLRQQAQLEDAKNLILCGENRKIVAWNPEVYERVVRCTLIEEEERAVHQSNEQEAHQRNRALSMVR